VWECTCPEAVEARRKHASPELIAEAISDPDNPLFTRALQAHPGDVHHSQAKTQVLSFRRNGYIIDDRSDWTFSGEVYYDGSCFQHEVQELSTASFGIVQLNSEGEVTAELRGTVPIHMPQSAQSAEHCGRSAAIQHLVSQSTLYGDCLNVVKAGRKPSKFAAGYKSFHGGPRRQSDASGRSHFVSQDIKVKAHRKEEQADGHNDLIRIRGNNAADKVAVSAQQLHPGIAGADDVKIGHDSAKLRRVAATIADTLCLWPKAERSEKGEATSSKSKRQSCKTPDHPEGHEWHWQHGLWRCKRCLVRAKSGVGMKRRRLEKCPGMSLKIVGALADDCGHSVFAGDDEQGQPVMFCITCGCWATARPVLLQQQCRGTPSRGSAGEAALKRLATRRHPDPRRNVTIQELQQISGATIADVRQALDAHLGIVSAQQSNPGPKRCRSRSRSAHSNGAIPGAFSTLSDSQAGELSDAQKRLRAVRERIRTKESSLLPQPAVQQSVPADSSVVSSATQQPQQSAGASSWVG